MAGAENQSGRKESGRDADSIRRRLDHLGEQLAEARGRHDKAPGREPHGQGAALGQALRLGIELVAGVAVGGFIGWALDRWLGTAPFLMVVFLGLGAAAGIMNVVRTAKRMQAEASSVKDLPSVPDDDD
ncbi:MAG TPA: AtpZ/AtpI family protein [Methyloceanibacter sp.]|jgi:ATP synthase protein I|nr:AtpZ/AtpI family protein [Methyloceanibacter sp.]